MAETGARRICFRFSFQGWKIKNSCQKTENYPYHTNFQAISKKIADFQKIIAKILAYLKYNAYLCNVINNLFINRLETGIKRKKGTKS